MMGVGSFETGKTKSITGNGVFFILIRLGFKAHLKRPFTISEKLEGALMTTSCYYLLF